MKHLRNTLLALMTLTLLAGVLLLPVSAKDLEVCRLCNGSREYHCKTCGNAGTVVCDGCGGSGKWVCPGEEGKGKCSNGWYTCPSCNGDGKSRPIPADGNAGPCGNCGGTGKKECWHCHGTGGGVCDRCGGAGRAPCQDGACQLARAKDYKCPKCSGAGYVLLGNPMPPDSANDGVRNVPAPGDHIITNDKTWSYYVYTGSGGTSSGSKPTPDQGGGSGTVSREQTSSQALEEIELPEDRSVPFDVVAGDEHQPFARLEPGEMSEEELRFYAGINEADLAERLAAVQRILPNLRPGEESPALAAVLDALVKYNALQSRGDGRLYPVACDEEVELGFPVDVALPIPQGELGGGKQLILYRLTGEGAILPVGRVDTGTYEDGSVERIHFKTSGFSDFFLADEDVKVDLPAPVDTAASEAPSDPPGEGNGFPWYAVAIVAVVLIGCVALIIILIRKKKQP